MENNDDKYFKLLKELRNFELLSNNDEVIFVQNYLNDTLDFCFRHLDQHIQNPPKVEETKTLQEWIDIENESRKNNVKTTYLKLYIIDMPTLFDSKTQITKEYFIKLIYENPKCFGEVEVPTFF